MDNRTITTGNPSRDSSAENSRWTWEEDKQFEGGLVEIPEDSADRWERIAARLGTKSAVEAEQHYVVLLADVRAIEAGLIESPEYVDRDACRSSEPQKGPKSEKKQIGVQRKTGRPWTEDEHRYFLILPPSSYPFVFGTVLRKWVDVFWSGARVPVLLGV